MENVFVLDFTVSVVIQFFPFNNFACPKRPHFRVQYVTPAGCRRWRWVGGSACRPDEYHTLAQNGITLFQKGITLAPQNGLTLAQNDITLSQNGITLAPQNGHHGACPEN